MASPQLYHEHYQRTWLSLLLCCWNHKLRSSFKILTVRFLRQHFCIQRLLCWQWQPDLVLWNDLVLGLPNSRLFQLLFPHLRRVFRDDAKLPPSCLRSGWVLGWTKLWPLYFDSELCDVYNWIFLALCVDASSPLNAQEDKRNVVHY